MELNEILDTWIIATKFDNSIDVRQIKYCRFFREMGIIKFDCLDEKHNVIMPISHKAYGVESKAYDTKAEAMKVFDNLKSQGLIPSDGYLEDKPTMIWADDSRPFVVNNTCNKNKSPV